MKLGIILGSTRPGRLSPRQATWVHKVAGQVEGVDAELVDLQDYPMPFFNEPVSPRYNPDRQIAPEVQKWLDKVSEFDAYVFVTPEYNHSMPAVLKNAFDFITSEINRKPVAVVSHGSAGGARAATDLKEVVSESRGVPIPNFITMTGMHDMIDEHGDLSEALKANPYNPEAQLVVLLTELKWYSDALSTARNQGQ